MWHEFSYFISAQAPRARALPSVVLTRGLEGFFMSKYSVSRCSVSRSTEPKAVAT